MKIPRRMHQIWVGPKPPPMEWMNTWKIAHPEWEYRLWTNHDLKNEAWTNRQHMTRYLNRHRYDGVADLMRYEILFRYGGIVIAADSTCLYPIDDLFDDRHELYTISTEYERNRCIQNRGATTPLYASTPGHWFALALVHSLYHVKLLDSPVRTTGNRFMQKMLRRWKPPIKVWPMHTFIGEHYNGWRYTGPDRVYAKHFWGTTRGAY